LLEQKIVQEKKTPQKKIQFFAEKEKRKEEKGNT